MGWLFGPNENEQLIKKEVIEINRVLNEFIRYLDRIGSTGEYCSAQLIEKYLADIDKHIYKIQSVSSKVSVSTAAKIQVPWIDGRLLPLPNWERCYQSIMAKIAQDFEYGKYMNV